MVGRLVVALRAQGASWLAAPSCARCRREVQRLTRSSATGGVCARCRRRELAETCARCGIVKPVAGRDSNRRPVCARCADRPQRECGRCGRIRRIARRAHGDQPDICDGCFQQPQALCAGCGRLRPYSFASTLAPICTSCAPRRTAVCARCGQDKPPAANWAEGPVCDPCYTAALRHRGTCSSCHTTRRLVSPPGPDATCCAGCAGLPATHVCIDCGLEDKLYERSRCQQCALRRRTGELLRAGGEQIPAPLIAVHEAIVATSTPRTALNWLRKGAGAAVLADLAAGTTPISHAALDAHPRRRGRRLPPPRPGCRRGAASPGRRAGPARDLGRHRRAHQRPARRAPPSVAGLRDLAGPATGASQRSTTATAGPQPTTPGPNCSSPPGSWAGSINEASRWPNAAKATSTVGSPAGGPATRSGTS
jgi:hypothetical protein